MKLKYVFKAVAATLACALTMGIVPDSHKHFPNLSITASAESYNVVYPEENVDIYIVPEGSSNYAFDLCGGGTDTYTNFHLYEKNGSRAQIYYLKRVDGDWYIIVHKESGKCVNVVNDESYDDARLWLYPYYENDYASQFRFAAAGDSYIIQNRLDTQRIIDLHDNIAYSGAKIHLWTLHDNQSGRWQLIPVKSSNNSYEQGVYSNFATGSYVVNSSNGINVRSGAGSGYSRVGAAKNNITFEVTKTNGNWGYTGAIQCTNGWQAGWVCLDYCTKTSGNSNNSSNVSYNNYANISLDVPHYLQSDKRWRSKKLGNSNYSIWGYGCTVTSVAMMYSYNNNCTVYPDEIMESLKFTSKVAVYWQGIYDLGFSYTSGSNKAITQSLMKKIYTQLENGRPVMIGSYNSSGDELLGGYHWV